MNVVIKSEEELVGVTKELIHVLANLRKFTKLWEKSHGVELRDRKKYYEAKADALIEKLKITEHRSTQEIKIKIQ